LPPPEPGLTFAGSARRASNAKPGHEAKAHAFTDVYVQASGAYGENIGAEACNRAWGFTRAARAVRQADELATRLVAALGETIPDDHHGIKKIARASRPGRRASIIAVADIDRAVGAPFPAAVVNEETMVMVVMTMAKMTMAKMPVAMPVVPAMAVASTVPAMSTVTVTSSESLARDGHGSRGQRQSSNRGGNDRLDLRHGRLLVEQSEDRPAIIHP
jgi:hypothetical protein